jgi:hypothetical protein
MAHEKLPDFSPIFDKAAGFPVGAGLKPAPTDRNAD